MVKLKWKLLSRQICFQTKWFDISQTEALLPNGEIIKDYYSIENKDAVMVVAINESGKILLKQEYRLPVDRVLYELPAGSIEKCDLTPLDAAKRELLEETGYISSDWTYLGCTYDCPDRCSSKLHLYCAKEARYINEKHPDRTEVLEVQLVDFNTAIEMCLSGEIAVNSCINGIMRTAKVLKPEMFST